MEACNRLDPSLKKSDYALIKATDIDLPSHKHRNRHGVYYAAFTGIIHVRIYKRHARSKVGVP